MAEPRLALPPILAAIADAAGLDAALAIARAYGGTRVTMPLLADGDNWLVGLVGSGPAAAIIEALGPTRRIDMPLAPGSSSWRQWRHERARRIAELEAAGASAAGIAREMGMTARAVHFRRAERRRRRDDGQDDLFG